MFDRRETRPPDEPSKLSATYLNGVAVALVAVGGFAPLASLVYSSNRQPLWIVAAANAICLFVSLCLHFVARHLVKGRKS